MRKQLKTILTCTVIMTNAASYAKQFTNNKKEVIMVNTQQEKQKRNAETYFKKIEAGEFDNEYSELFTKAVIDEFFQIQLGKKQGNLADLFADSVDFDLPGNEEKFPWVGKRNTKKEVEDFFKVLYQNIKSEKFEVEFIAINGENAVAVGQLSSVILKYNKVFSTQFVNIFKVRNGKIVKYHFMEDSFRLNEEMK